ncbi:hypothetical protein M9H77_09429 [Catharanthus roseus]|uniref:Uncharacterized protein n=1 Tax=Catharanthus roseus TaxID=4058 RepID=A0ACC0C0Y4_CATRO|nr:hypothetical protein M9H77_09429 [Catharanthus roseus]
MFKDKIAFEVGDYYVDDSDNNVGSSKIKDPVGMYVKAERNIRKKSIITEILLYVVLSKKMGSIPERNFMNMIVMSMLSAFNSSQVSKRLTTLLSNTVIVVAAFSIKA